MDNLTYFEWFDKYLKDNGFWYADFGNYCFGKKEDEDLVGIHVELDGDWVFISAIKFPECSKSSELIVSILRPDHAKNILDMLIFVIKHYEQPDKD